MTAKKKTTTDGAGARATRARRLQEAIDRARSGQPVDTEKPESPRAFIERKMRGGSGRKPGS
jgi:hypothetical protein